MRLVLLGCALALAACASVAPNPPLARYEPKAGYDFERLERGENSDELFVILAFSGGGTRAAALAFGVLEALRDTTVEWRGRRRALLDEVDVISSASGGSFPAAYYALRGRGIFEEFPERFLYRRLQSELVRELFSPANWLKLLGRDYGRSDLAAEFYHREVFGGATYAEVIARRARPFVILNATDMTTGAQFPFIQDQFDPMCSDLAGVPLARAAAASSAFPGALTALTFRSYAGTCGYRHPAWVELALKDHDSRINMRRTARAENRVALADPGRSYLHLVDGGVADNIGLRGPLDALTSVNHPWSVLRMMNERKIRHLVVVVVNAATSPATQRDQSATVPSLVDTVTAAATVPLENYSFETLELLRSTVRELNQEPGALRVELYPVEAAFEFIKTPEERAWFKNLPTSFELPRETIDRLRAIGRRLLAEDPEFQRLMKALRGQQLN